MYQDDPQEVTCSERDVRGLCGRPLGRLRWHELIHVKTEVSPSFLAISFFDSYGFSLPIVYEELCLREPRSLVSRILLPAFRMSQLFDMILPLR